MRIVLGIPVFNEMDFIDQSVENIISMEFDDVVYLDDGSVDGTYDKLIEYSKKYDNLHVFRTESNSVLSKSHNRWKILANYCSEFNPDWIMIRAADQKFSLLSKDLLRKRLEIIYEKNNANVVAFPVVHFWRSPWWYRIDPPWGGSALGHTSLSCWRNDSEWKFVGAYNEVGMHRGGHRPNKFSKKMIVENINSPDINPGPFPISVLHYGMASDELIAKKLEFQLEMSIKANDPLFLRPASDMPHPKKWNNFNGYKVAYELNMELVKAPDMWYESPVPDTPRPKVKSLYNIIAKYNKPMAEEYAKIYGK